jgi:hypothetical protein
MDLGLKLFDFEVTGLNHRRREESIEKGELVLLPIRAVEELLIDPLNGLS